MRKLKLFFACLLMAVLSIGQVWGAIADGTYVVASSLESGAHYILTGVKNSTTYTVSNVNNNNNRKTTSVVVNSNGSITVASNSSVCTFTLGGSSNAWTFCADNYLVSNQVTTNCYLRATSSSSNNLGLNNSAIDDNARWTMGSFSSGVATMTANGTNSRKDARFNTNGGNDPIFGCYATTNTSTGVSIKFYRKAVQGASNNTNYGTVSVAGDVITATPKTGYRVATSNAYTISPTGKATVSQSGNVFTLTNVTAVVTLTVNFEADVQDFTITPATNDANLGTVNLVGSVITATPAEGCRIASTAYNVTNGTATVVRGTGEHINEFTVTPTSDCTVRINFETIPTHTIHFNTGGLVDIADATDIKEGDTYNITQTPAASLTNSCEYGTFVGWTTASSIADASVKPTIITNYQMGNADRTLYAVYSKTVPGAGPSGSVTITHESTNFPETYAAATDYELEGYTFNIKQIYKNGKMQWRSSTNGNGAGVIYNKSTFPAKISSIVLTYTNDSQTYNHVLHVGDDANPTSGTEITGTTDENVVTYDCSGSDADYFVLANGEGAGYTSSLVINYGSAGTTTYSLDANCCTQYNVNIAAGVTNGSVSADPASACEGATVTLTFTPNSNYHLSGWTLNGTAQDIAENTFTMPAAAVTISATFDTDDLPTYTANWYVNGTKVHNQTDIEGATLTNIPSDFSSVADCSDLTFRGWLTAPLASVSATKPVDLIESTTGMTMPNGGANYYAVFAEATPSLTPGNVDYDHTISAKTWTADGEQTLSSVAWTLDNGSDFYGYDATKGQQIGSGSDAATSASLSTSGISGTINSVTIYTSGANSIAGSVSVSVNGEDYTTTGSATSASLTSSNAGYTFSGSEEGDIVISWSQTSSKAMYFKRIVVNHVEMIAGVSYSNYVTSCPHCASVTLNNSSVEHGTIALQVNSADVSVVKTCDDASVNVVASPETGYELTDVALSGVDGATYSTGVISIPKDKEGTLVVTATFSPVDYVVTLAQSPAVGANLTGGKDDAHYGETINISTTIPSNAFFVNWTSSDVTITNPTSATGASFTMPAKNVTVTANFTEVHNVAWAIANTPSSGTLAGVYVKGIVKANPNVETGYKNATYYICDLDANGEPANEFYVYRGKNVGNTDFTNVNQLTEGDEVIIYGTLKTYSSVKEFDAGNYIIANGRTAASISSVEVSGDADKTEYFAGETFEYAGLSARAIYNTGYQKNVTPTWEANTEASYIVSTSETINVTATYGGKTSANYPVAVEVTTKVLESIDVTPAALTGYKGVALPKPTTVTAHFDDGGIKSTQNVAALAIYDEAGDYDATSTAEQTIQVKYTFGLNTRTANYTVTLSSIVNTIDAAYSVEKAQEIVDIDRAEGNNLDLANTDNKVYVTGVVTSISGSSPYTIQIKDNTADETFLELYKCTFNGVTSVEVGDIIKAYGNLEWYPSLSKYELSEGGQVVWKQQIAVTGVTLADEQDVVTLKEGKTIQLEATVAPANASNKNMTWESSDPSVASVDDNGLVTAEAIGTATITVTTEEGGFTATCAVTVIDASTRTTGNAVFQKVTAGPITDGQYLIVCASELVAFDGGLTDLDISSNTIAITIDDGLIVAPEDASFTINASTGSIKSYSNKYIGNGSNSNALSVSDDPLTNTLSIDASENFVVVSAGGAYLRYNKSSGQERFKYFKSGTYTAQQAIQLYKKVEATEIRTGLSDGKWGTICPAKKVLVPAGASFYKLNYMELNPDGSPYKFFFDEIGENAYLEAGKPYLFIAEGTTITGVKVGDAAADGLHVHNGFVGYLGSGNYDLSSDYDVYTAGANNYYGLQNNIFKLIYGGNSYMVNERAFVQITPTSKPATTEQPAPAYSRRRLVVGAGAPQVTTGTENIEASETPVKVMIDGQLFILRGEKMYDATGRLVK